MAFAPDGRLFVGERIEGHIRIIDTNGQLLTTPFLTLDVPKDGNGNPVRHNSAGVRGFTFDPDYANNGYFYVFYMKQFPGGVRHNRVSRFTADPNDPNQALTGSELVLMELPFNNGGLGGSRLGSSGSHNGGAILFGGDGKLYFTTGDGWNNNGSYAAGDNVQSLSTYTGKMFRINKDGTIPTDNPFYHSTTGNYRAIYALGLRNPYSAAAHPLTGEIFIFDVGTVWGDTKDYIYRLDAADNYGHDGTGSGLGNIEQPWLRTGSRIISGGAFYYGAQFPEDFLGNLFVSGWGGDDIRKVVSASDPTISEFASDEVANNGPLYVQIGPDGSLYYLKSTYETNNGEIYKISYTGTNRVNTPAISPAGGEYIQSVAVAITTFTEGAAIYYTLDGGDPTQSSTLYTAPFYITQTGTLKARAYKAGLDPSSIISAPFTIQPGTAPQFTSSGVTEGVTGALYQYDADATGLPAPAYFLEESPAGMVIDEDSGLITWTPGSPGNYAVTVRAANGVNPDALQSFTIEVLDLRLAENPMDITNGLHYSYFEGQYPALPDYRVLEAKASGNVTGPDLSVRLRDDDFVLRFYGYLFVPENGDYTFYLDSEEGAVLYIGDTLLLNNDPNSGGGAAETSGSIGLQAGYHSISLEYYNRSAPPALNLSYAGPGLAKMPVPNSAFHRHIMAYGVQRRAPSVAYLNFPEVPNGPNPATLSATGAFDDLASLTPVPGILPYLVNSPLWSDGAEKYRWISVPGNGRITYRSEGPWDFPAGTVFIKHFEVGTEGRRLETRFIIVMEGGGIYGVTYRWREDYSDADLVGESGLVETVIFDGGKEQMWSYPSRAACVQCHNESVNYVLGVRTGQLNGDERYPATGVTDNQLRTWHHLGLFEAPIDESLIEQEEKWVAVDDVSASLERRAKSYLAANCAFCHNPDNSFLGADFDGRYETPLEEMNLYSAANNTLGTTGAQVVKPQDPHRSTLFRRLQTNDEGVRMPPVARDRVDQDAVEAVLKWIVSLDASTSTDVTDYLSRWRFDGNVDDGTGAATSAWRTGGVGSFQTGQLNQAADFDGTNDAVDLGGYDLSGEEMTITFWFRADDFGTSDARFISKADGSSDADHYWMVSTLNSTRLRFRLKTGGNTTTLSTNTGEIEAGTWYHVAAVYDGAQMRIYKNGAQITSTAKTGAINQNSGIPVSIGNQPASADGGARPFDGLLDDLRLYGRALTMEEIQTVHEAGAVTNENPEVEIAAPLGGSIFVESTSVEFSGTASDLEDGNVMSSAEWFSTRQPDQSFGTGPSFASSALPAGEQLIYVTVTDSEGAAGTSLRSLQVLTALQDWGMGFGLSGDDLLHFANSDGGIFNLLLERFFDGDPSSGLDDAGLSPVLISPGTGMEDVFGMRFRKAEGIDHVATFLYSPDMRDWQDASTLPGFQVVPAGVDLDGTPLYEMTVSAEGWEHLFLKMRVTE